MSQIIVLEKNAIDLDITDISITASDDEATDNGQDFVDLLRDRTNTSGWGTTGSSDTATCTLEVDLNKGLQISKVYLIEHNFKNYDLHYWNGTAWVLIISVTNNTDTTSYHSFTAATVYKVKITINATMIANSDKLLAQLIITDNLGTGQFQGYPEIRQLTHTTNKKANQMLSGKIKVIEGIGAVQFELKWTITSNDNDLTLIEKMYTNKQGFLISLSGGNESQFSTQRIGYRKKDIYFVRMTDDYSDPFFKGIYSIGNVITAKLKEAVA